MTQNYGEVLSKLQSKNCVAFVTFGPFHSDWIAVLENERDLDIWRGENNEELLEGSMEVYASTLHPMLTIPKSAFCEMPLGTFKQLFPKSVKDEIIEKDIISIFQEIKKVCRITLF
jgi:hypothetical protein